MIQVMFIHSFDGEWLGKCGCKAVAQEQRKLLTDEDIKQITGASDDYWASSKLFIIAIFRSAEKAHGINE